MTKTPRNAPCPCGSGRKYKQCCARTDPLGTATEAAASNGSPLAGAAAADEWQAEIVPLPIDIESAPRARPTALLVTAGGFILHSDILTASLAETEEIAAQLAIGVEKAAATLGGLPYAVAVRWPEVAAALQDRLGVNTTVRCRAFLEDLEAPARSLLANVADYPYWPSVSRPESWLAWGLPRSVITELFDAAAAFHRAAPWRRLDGEPPLRAILPGGRQWTVSVMGAGGEEFGLAMYERFDDYIGAVTNEDIPAGVSALVGKVVGVALTPGADLSPAMRREVATHRWHIASSRAYPLIMPLNTPAGGLSRADAADLIALLRVIPDFVEAHADALDAMARGVDAQLDVRGWVHQPTGAIVAYDTRLRFGAWAGDGQPLDDDPDDYALEDDFDAFADDVYEIFRPLGGRLRGATPSERERRGLPRLGTPEAAPALVADACARIDQYAQRDRMAGTHIIDGAKQLLREYERTSSDELARALKPEVWAAGALLAASRRHQPGVRTASSLAHFFDVSTAAVSVRARKLENAVGFVLDDDQDAGVLPTDASIAARDAKNQAERIAHEGAEGMLSLWPDDDARPDDAPAAGSTLQPEPAGASPDDAVVLPFRRREPASAAQNAVPTFTQVQGQYLSFIHYYTKVHRVPPSESDMRAFFRVSPPSVHNMVKMLEKKGLVARVPGQARTIRVLVPRELLPELD